MHGEDLSHFLALALNCFVERGTSPAIESIYFGTSVDKELCYLSSVFDGRDVQWRAEIIVHDH